LEGCDCYHSLLDGGVTCEDIEVCRLLGVEFVKMEPVEVHKIGVGVGGGDQNYLEIGVDLGVVDTVSLETQQPLLLRLHLHRRQLLPH
jgi:hypothetical protein